MKRKTLFNHFTTLLLIIILITALAASCSTSSTPSNREKSISIFNLGIVSTEPPAAEPPAAEAPAAEPPVAEPPAAEPPAATISCIIDNEFLSKLNSKIPYEEFNITHNIIDETYTLGIWFVDPELSTSVSEENFEENKTLAISHAAEIIHILRNADPCVEVFTVINPIVVDTNYFGWFSGTITPEEVPESQTITDDEINKIIDDIQIGYLIENPPEPLGPPPAGSCTWAETLEKINRHFNNETLNIGFYYVRDRNGNNVWAQWYVPDPSDAYLFALPSIMNIAMELDCLYPSPTNIYTIVMVQNHQMVIIGILPRSESGGELNDMLNEFDIADYNYNIFTVDWP